MTRSFMVIIIIFCQFRNSMLYIIPNAEFDCCQINKKKCFAQLLVAGRQLLANGHSSIRGTSDKYLYIVFRSHTLKRVVSTFSSVCLDSCLFFRGFLFINVICIYLCILCPTPCFFYYILGSCRLTVKGWLSLPDNLIHSRFYLFPNQVTKTL